MTKALNILILIVFLCFQFAPANAQIDSVVYSDLAFTGGTGGHSTIILYSDSTFKYYLTPCDICPQWTDKHNLYSYGKYVPYKKKAYYLYSSPELNKSDMPLTVSESITPDSILRITLDLPAANDSGNWFVPHYFYALEITYHKIEDSVGSSVFNKSYYQESTHFNIPWELGCVPTAIVVKVYSKNNGSFLATERYIVQNFSSNTFHISMPYFHTGFLEYKRLNYHRLTRYGKWIIGDETQIYLRTDSPKRIHKLRYKCPWQYNIPYNPYWKDEEED